MLKRKIKAIHLLLLGLRENNYGDASIHFENAFNILKKKKIKRYIVLTNEKTMDLKNRTPKSYNDGLQH